MSALAKIEAYLTEKFASHNVAELMGHLEAAIKVEVEAAVAEVRAEVEKLRAELTGGRAPAPVAPPAPAPAAEQAAEPASAPSASSAQ